MITKRAATLKNSVDLKIPFDEEYSRGHLTLLWHKNYANRSIVREDRVEKLTTRERDNDRLSPD